MKQLSLFLIIFFFISCDNKNDELNDNHCNQKFIIAGDSINTCFEIIDISPDTVITPYLKIKSTKASGSGYYELDIDGDLINDLKFSTYFNVSAGGWTGDYGSKISTINNQIAYAVDSSSNYVQLFTLNDTINSNAQWNYIPEIKIALTLFGTCQPICPGYEISINDNVSNGFIGLRTITNVDTNYFYVNLDVVSSNTLVIKSIARKKKQ